MITTIEIENLRGIRHGRLEGLRPLTILTGPNACGKSAVLDALLIGAGSELGEALGRAVARHPRTLNGARWLVHRSGTKAIVRLEDEEVGWESRLQWTENCPTDLQTKLEARGARGPFSAIGLQDQELTYSSRVRHKLTLGFSLDNEYEVGSGITVAGSSDPRTRRFTSLADPGLPTQLHPLFSKVYQEGRREAVEELIATLVSDFVRLDILTEGEDSPVLHITTKERSVPVSLSGDGIQAFVQLALQIAVAPEGLVLVEEPEVYQHPKAIWQSARAILANVRRGVQMALTTHSLELIDALLAQAEDGDQEGMVLFNLLLEDGELKVGRRAGEEIAFARETLENDLR